MDGYHGNLSKVTPMPCDIRHVFHTKCIEEWFLNENCCPMCKTPITNAEMRRIDEIIANQSKSLN